MEIYVVIKNGCVSFISSTSDDIKAHVIDLDEPDTSSEELDEPDTSSEELDEPDTSSEELEVAENLTRIW